MDRIVSDWIEAHASPISHSIAAGISLVGSPLAMGGLALGVGVLFALRRQWIVLGGWAAAFLGGGLLDLVLKLVIRRPRPPGAAAFLARTSWSFPSGHAMGSLIGFGMLAYVMVVFWVHPRRWQIAVVLCAGAMILAVGLSRLALGVHYFSDVIAGYAAGALWLGACISGIELARSPDAERSRSTT